MSRVGLARRAARSAHMLAAVHLDRPRRRRWDRARRTRSSAGCMLRPTGAFGRHRPRGPARPAWRGSPLRRRCWAPAVGKQTRRLPGPAHLLSPSARPDPLHQLELVGSGLLGPASTEQAGDPPLQHLGGRFGGGQLAGDRCVGEQPVDVHALGDGAVEGALRGGPGRIGRHLARGGLRRRGPYRPRLGTRRVACAAGGGRRVGGRARLADASACRPCPVWPRPPRRRSSSRAGSWRGGPRWPGWTAGGSRASGALRGWPAAPR
jgi:hypothetical protein